MIFNPVSIVGVGVYSGLIQWCHILLQNHQSETNTTISNSYYWHVLNEKNKWKEVFYFF